MNPAPAAAAAMGRQMDPEEKDRRMNPAAVAAAAAATGCQMHPLGAVAKDHLMGRQMDPAAASTGHQMDQLEAADRRMYPQPVAASATGRLMDPAVVVGRQMDLVVAVGRQMYQVVPLSLHETLA